MPLWALLVAPPLAVLLFSGDDIVLLFTGLNGWPRGTRAILVAGLPLSVVVGLWTLSVLVRSRREIIRRSRAEADLRRSLDDLQRSLRHEHLLHRELDHRVRNTLAGLIGLISLYEMSGRSADQMAQALRGKILALKEVHDGIDRTGGGEVNLAVLVKGVCDAVVPADRRANIQAKGPGVRLTTAEASALAITLQELLTNSLKHGALGVREGFVSIRWAAGAHDDGVVLDLDWSESPVPAKTGGPKGRSGVGLPLIEGLARSDLSGEVLFAHEGDRWRVHLHGVLSLPCATPRARKVQV